MTQCNCISQVLLIICYENAVQRKKISLLINYLSVIMTYFSYLSSKNKYIRDEFNKLNCLQIKYSHFI